MRSRGWWRRYRPVVLAALTGALVAFVVIDIHHSSLEDCRQVQSIVLADRRALLLRRQEIGQPGSASAHYTAVEKLRARQLADGQLAFFHVRRCR